MGAFEQDRAEIELLVARCRHGDQRAWQKLVDRYARLVFASAIRIGLSHEQAEDVMQFTFVALHRELDRIETVATLPKWLVTVASREACRIKRLASQKSTASIETLSEVLEEEDSSVDLQVLASERHHKLWKAMDQLPEHCRRLVYLLFWEDMDYKEVSQNLKMPIGSIGATRARCLTKLVKRLQDSGFE